MKDFAKRFYNSTAWKKTRDYVIVDRRGICERCGKAGEIVHHKIYLTESNINNPYITLGLDNLELVCRDCHSVEHEGELATDKGLRFDEYGNLIVDERKPRHTPPLDEKNF